MRRLDASVLQVILFLIQVISEKTLCSKDLTRNLTYIIT